MIDFRSKNSRIRASRISGNFSDTEKKKCLLIVKDQKWSLCFLFLSSIWEVRLRFALSIVLLIYIRIHIWIGNSFFPTPEILMIVQYEQLRPHSIFYTSILISWQICYQSVMSCLKKIFVSVHMGSLWWGPTNRINLNWEWNRTFMTPFKRGV